VEGYKKNLVKLLKIKSLFLLLNLLGTFGHY